MKKFCVLVLFFFLVPMSVFGGVLGALQELFGYNKGCKNNPPPVVVRVDETTVSSPVLLPDSDEFNDPVQQSRTIIDFDQYDVANKSALFGTVNFTHSVYVTSKDGAFLIEVFDSNNHVIKGGDFLNLEDFESKSAEGVLKLVEESDGGIRLVDSSGLVDLFISSKELVPWSESTTDVDGKNESVDSNIAPTDADPAPPVDLAPPADAGMETKTILLSEGGVVICGSRPEIRIVTINSPTPIVVVGGNSSDLSVGGGSPDRVVQPDQIRVAEAFSTNGTEPSVTAGTPGREGGTDDRTILIPIRPD